MLQSSQMMRAVPVSGAMQMSTIGTMPANGMYRCAFKENPEIAAWNPKVMYSSYYEDPKKAP